MSEQDLLSYEGGEVPAWVKDDALVRVKSTPRTRMRKGDGIRCKAGYESKSDDHVWAGEIGKVVRRVGNGWWDWAIDFDRGRRVNFATISEHDLSCLVKYKPKK